MANVPTERLAVKIAAEVKGFDPAQHFDARRLSMLDRVSQFALVAAREAIPSPDAFASSAERAGVVLGASLGQQTLDAAYGSFHKEQAKRLHPMTVPRSMPSAAASQVSMEFGVRGPCFAIASACASSSHAVGLAFHMVRAGTLDLAITGGSDASIQVGFLKAWESLRVLSPDSCRPFSMDRSGLVIGEAGAVLVLEPFESARARGAVIHAEVVGFGMSADAADLTAPRAAGAAQAMRAALDDAGLPAESVGYVNAHGTGTRLNDKTEVEALGMVFGNHLERIPVSSSKSMFGHCLNAGGALELAVTALALREGVLPPTVGYRAADPDCAIDCVPNRARAAVLNVAMSNSFAFGGLNAALVLARAA
jgi:nodulation protein E